MTAVSIPRLVVTLVGAMLATGATGCFWATTKSEGKALRKDVTLLAERISAKEADLTVKMEQLTKVLDEATKLLKRNSADLGADVEGLRTEVRVSNGLVTAATTISNEIKAAFEQHQSSSDARLAEIDRRLLVLEGRGGISPPGTAVTTTTTPDELWAAARDAFDKEKWDEANEAFKKMAKFPTHERADDAQYFRGGIYFRKEEWEKAIVEYQKVFEKFATSELADDALFRAAEAAQMLKNCTEARAYLGLLKQKYPKSPLLAKAAKMDKALTDAAKKKAKCTS